MSTYKKKLQSKSKDNEGTVKTNMHSINDSTKSEKRKKTKKTSKNHRPFVSGIKNGMTVEDLKRLTQMRMKDRISTTVSPPRSPNKSSSRSPSGSPSRSPFQSPSRSPSRNSNHYSLSPSRAPVGLPSTGITVQQLKEMTNRRLAQQNLKLSNLNDSNAKLLSRKTLENTYNKSFDENDSSSISSSPSSVKSSSNVPYRSFAPSPLKLDHDAPLNETMKKFFLSDEDHLNDLPPPPENKDKMVPSWSPPSSKKYSKGVQVSKSMASFYHKSKYEESNQIQNPVVEPPPGMPRRPSMMVPWQVAEAVLHTPQGKTQQKVSHEYSSKSPKISHRRGSFENAAQFFKFRRRSRSRLDFAKDSQLQRQQLALDDFFKELSIQESRENSKSLKSPKNSHTRNEFSDEINDPVNVSLKTVGTLKIRMGENLSRARKSIQIKDAAFDELLQHVRGSTDNKSKTPPRTPISSQRSSSFSSRGIVRRKSNGSMRQTNENELGERLAEAAKLVGACATNGDIDGFTKASAQLDRLKSEATNIMQS